MREIINIMLKLCLLMTIGFLCLVSCSSTKVAESKVAKRAAFDFECKEEGITITEIDDRTWGASGCGRRATYLMMCTIVGCGAPVMNSDISQKK